MKTRTGKIARLPRTLRNQLNQRLADGQPGPKLVRWLNRLPEVQHTMAQEFDGKPITQQNLSEWRAGGYREWLLRQETLEQARDLAADADDLHAATASQSGDHLLTDHLATLLTIRCVKALNHWEDENHEELQRQIHTLRGMAHDIACLARVSVEHRRLELIREKSQAELVDLFNAWVEIPAVREVVCGEHIAPEERKRILAEIYGRPYPATETQTTPPKPEAPVEPPPKPNRTQTNLATPAEKSPSLQSDAFKSNPLKSKRGRKQWLKDPTSCDQSGRQPLPTPEERRKAIRQIYGLPEEAPFGSNKPASQAKLRKSNTLPPAIPSPLNGERARVRGGNVQDAPQNTNVQSENQTQSDLIKPTDDDPETLAQAAKAQADRRWRIQHGFETETPPTSEVGPVEKQKT